MKRVMTVMIAAALIIAAAACTSFGASDGFRYKTKKTGKCYITRFYDHKKCVGKIKTSKRLEVCVIESSALTEPMLTARRNKCIIVEIIRGKCVDKTGNGETADGNYISYKRVKGHKKGANYTTYAVYGNNNSIDDVRVRIDVRGRLND